MLFSNRKGHNKISTLGSHNTSIGPASQELYKKSGLACKERSGEGFGVKADLPSTKPRQ